MVGATRSGTTISGSCSSSDSSKDWAVRAASALVDDGTSTTGLKTLSASDVCDSIGGKSLSEGPTMAGGLEPAGSMSTGGGGHMMIIDRPAISLFGIPPMFILEQTFKPGPSS